MIRCQKILLKYIIVFLLAPVGAAWSGDFPIYSAIKKIITEIRPTPEMKDIDQFLSKAPKLPVSLPLRSRIELVNKYIFEEFKFKPDASFLARSEKDNVLPDSTIKTHTGHCLGLSILYLLIAEKNNQEAYLVRAPDHVFVRYCESGSCLNVETLKRGAIVPDNYYIENLTIPKQALGINYLVSLKDPKELAASIYLGLGYISAKSGQQDLAVLFYKKASELSATFAEPHSNLAALYFQRGQTSQAKKELESALKINSTNYAALLNTGALFQAAQDPANALVQYNRAIESNPVSYEAYSRRSQIFASLKRGPEALLDLDRVLAVQPKFCDVMEKRNALAKQFKLPEKPELIKTASELQKTGQCLYLPQ